MLYRALADLLVVVHLAFIVFATTGGLLALRVHWIPWIHLPAALWAIVVVSLGWICPLTPLENAMRRAGGDVGYASGFIDYYIVPIVYPVGLTREMQIVFGLGLLVLNMAIYIFVWVRSRAARHDAPQDSATKFRA